MSGPPRHTPLLYILVQEPFSGGMGPFQVHGCVCVCARARACTRMTWQFTRCVHAAGPPPPHLAERAAALLGGWHPGSVLCGFLLGLSAPSTSGGPHWRQRQRPGGCSFATGPRRFMLWRRVPAQLPHSAVTAENLWFSSSLFLGSQSSARASSPSFWAVFALLGVPSLSLLLLDEKEKLLVSRWVGHTVDLNVEPRMLNRAIESQTWC